MKRKEPNIGAIPSSKDPAINAIKQALYELRDFMRELAAEQGGLPASKINRDAIPWVTVKKTGSSIKDIEDRSHNSTLLDVDQSDDTSSSSVGGKHVTDAQVKKYEDHRLITNANPHGTDHGQLDAIAQADDTSADATGGKHVTDALVKKYEDHRNASQNIHGVGSGNSVVGTGTAQEITNKKYGGNIHYSEFEADGTLHMVGDATVWRDDNFAGVALGIGASPPDLIALNGGAIYVRAFDGNATVEQMFGATEIQHDYKEGSDIVVHIHWSPTTANAGNVKWQLSYQWLNIDGTFSSDTTISVTQAAGGTAWKANKVAFPTISGTGKTIGGQFICRLFRDPTDAADTYPDDAAITGTFGIHYELDTIGSRQATTK